MLIYEVFNGSRSIAFGKYLVGIPCFYGSYVKNVICGPGYLFEVLLVNA